MQSTAKTQRQRRNNSNNKANPYRATQGNTPTTFSNANAAQRGAKQHDKSNGTQRQALQDKAAQSKETQASQGNAKQSKLRIAASGKLLYRSTPHVNKF